MLSKLKSFFLSKEQIEPSFEYKGIVKYVPLIICGGFYFFTILLFEFGAYDWNVNNKLKLYTNSISIINEFINKKKIYQKKSINKAYNFPCISFLLKIVNITS